MPQGPRCLPSARPPAHELAATPLASPCRPSFLRKNVDGGPASLNPCQPHILLSVAGLGTPVPVSTARERVLHESVGGPRSCFSGSGSCPLRRRRWCDIPLRSE